MKYGLYLMYFQREWRSDLHFYLEMLPHISEMGFDIVEAMTNDLMQMTEEELEKLKICCEKNHITLTAGGGMSRSFDISSDNISVRKAGIKRIKSFLPVLKRLKIQKLCGMFYSYWMYDYSSGFDKKRAWKNSIECMREIADMLQDRCV